MHSIKTFKASATHVTIKGFENKWVQSQKNISEGLKTLMVEEGNLVWCQARWSWKLIERAVRSREISRRFASIEPSLSKMTCNMTCSSGYSQAGSSWSTSLRLHLGVYPCVERAFSSSILLKVSSSKEMDFNEV